MPSSPHPQRDPGVKAMVSDKTMALKLPSQKRSRDRVDAILEAARRLIAQKGSDDLKMQDIAKQANISIGSLYQYFPEKAAVIRALAVRYDVSCRACIADVLAQVNSAAALQQAYGLLIDEFYKLVAEEPAARDIWSGMQSDPVLRQIEMQETRDCSTLLSEAMLRAYPSLSPLQAELKALLLWTLGGAAARLAIAQKPEEAAIIIRQYKEMAIRELAFPGSDRSDHGL